MMKLVVKASVSEAESKDYDYIFDQPVVTIGRLKENDIQLPLSTVSGFHAQILKEGDAFYLLDRGSVNGTFLNGQRLAGGEKKLITDGDTIRIQSFEIYFSTGPGMQIEQGATVQVARQMVMEVLGSWESQSQERPRLIVMGGVDNGKQVEMTEGKNILLGRSPECDVLIDHASISRKHAEITFNWSGAFVRDLSSPNGVYVNDVRIPGTRKLHDRDEIRLGQQTSTDPVRVVFSNPAEALLSKIEGAHITDTRDGVQSKVVTGSIQQQEIQAAAPVPSSSADQSRVEVAEQKEQKQPQAEQPVGKKSISLWILVGGAAVVTLLLIAFAVFVISNQRSVSISQVEPPEGEPGDIITLRGKNLDSTRIQNVTILARDAAVIRRDRTNLQIRVPAFPNLAASQRQTEIVLAEESAEIARVPFVLLVTPQVESISPVSGKPGMEVRIRATGGAGTPSVYFGPYKTEVKSSADREIIAIVPEPAESIPDSGLLLQVTVRFQDVASKNSVPFTLYAETVALPETEAFQLSFLARPYPVVLGFNEYAVETKKIDIYMPDKGFVKERKRCMKEGLPFPSEELILKSNTEKSIAAIIREKLSIPENYRKYKARMYEIEPVFGHLKFNLGYRHFLLRSQKKVKGEFGLMCAAYNLMKIWKAKTGKKEKIVIGNSFNLAWGV